MSAGRKAGGRGAGTQRPLPQAGSLGGREAAARTRGGARRLLPQPPSSWVASPRGSYLGAPGSPFRHRELRGCREPRPPLAPPPRPLPVAAARGGGSGAGAGGAREEAGEECGRRRGRSAGILGVRPRQSSADPGSALGPPLSSGPGSTHRAPKEPSASACVLLRGPRPALPLPPRRRPHMPHPRELKAGRLLHVLFNIANIYGALCKYQTLSRGLGLQRRPRQTTWI